MKMNSFANEFECDTLGLISYEYALHVFTILKFSSGE